MILAGIILKGGWGHRQGGLAAKLPAEMVAMLQEEWDRAYH